LTVRPAGRLTEPPVGFAQAVPGTLVMFTMLVLLTSGAITLVLEREQGLLRRLASAPLSPGSIVLGKWIGRLCLALVQIGFALLVGSLLFGVAWGEAWPMVGVVLAGWAAFTASLAIVLANVTRTPAQTAGIGVFATQILAALGGCWWPIEITPAWMQTLARFLPTGWAMDAMHQLVNFGQPASVAAPHAAAMVAGALALGWVGTHAFRYQ
jgi:ABC-type multidrug transport system permease subunit